MQTATVASKRMIGLSRPTDYRVSADVHCDTQNKNSSSLIGRDARGDCSKNVFTDGVRSRER